MHYYLHITQLHVNRQKGKPLYQLLISYLSQRLLGGRGFSLVRRYSSSRTSGSTTSPGWGMPSGVVTGNLEDTGSHWTSWRFFWLLQKRSTRWKRQLYTHTCQCLAYSGYYHFLFDTKSIAANLWLQCFGDTSVIHVSNLQTAAETTSTNRWSRGIACKTQTENKHYFPIFSIHFQYPPVMFKQTTETCIYVYI